MLSDNSFHQQNHPDNWLTIVRWSIACLSGYYGKKPDGLTVFSAILDFAENQAIFTTFTHICQHKLIPPTGRYNLFRGAFPLYMIADKTEYDLDKETGCDFQTKTRINP